MAAREKRWKQKVEGDRISCPILTRSKITQKSSHSRNTFFCVLYFSRYSRFKTQQNPANPGLLNRQETGLGVNWNKSRGLLVISWGILVHCNDVIMSAMAYYITSLTIVNSTAYSGADKWKHQSYASLAFVRGIHRWLVNSPHNGPVTRKLLLLVDVIMHICCLEFGTFFIRAHVCVI